MSVCTLNRNESDLQESVSYSHYSAVPFKQASEIKPQCVLLQGCQLSSAAILLFLMPSSPTNIILHFMAFEELHLVIVGSCSERLTGFRINSLTPGCLDSSHVGVFTGGDDFYSV